MKKINRTILIVAIVLMVMATIIFTIDQIGIFNRYKLAAIAYTKGATHIRFMENGDVGFRLNNSIWVYTNACNYEWAIKEVRGEK